MAWDKLRKLAEELRNILDNRTDMHTNSNLEFPIQLISKSSDIWRKLFDYKRPFLSWEDSQHPKFEAPRLCLYS